MNRLILERVAHGLLSILVLSVVVFGLVRLTGDPVDVLLPDSVPLETVARVRRELGLDQPIFVQYAIYMANLAQGNLGDSYVLNASVSELIAQRMPATLLLATLALLFTLAIGLPLGVYSAHRRGSWLDRGVRTYAAFGQAAPSFWVGLILVMVFAVALGVLPAASDGSPSSFILPVFALSLGATAGLVRLIRSSMIEVLATDYVMFLRIKGVPEHMILWKHALRNAGLTALTFVGVLTAGLITGSVVIERVFSYPGIGSLLANSIVTRDFPVIQAVVLMFSAVYIGVNLAVDVLYIVLNPRLR